ncbi:hypothetical protein GCM10009809_14280 [Isoptericola hypogeus]|uniref:NlpC/P60 family protein n=1 Tax=Isoptericola hypogeus TaxID=300179 RepID=A0ABP4VA80_9MICO
MQVLNIEVPASLAQRWRGWFAPPRQPYVLTPRQAEAVGALDDRGRLSPELRDTFGLFGVPDDAVLGWIDEATFRAMSASDRAAVRQAQPERHHWPSAADPGRLDARMVRWVEDGVRPSRHDAVPDAAWAHAAASGLPGARGLAGRFPAASGPNCFGTVMAAAGVAGAEHEWMQREPFERWLAERAVALPRRSRPDDHPGTVLVWRSPAGQVEHAAITLGDGWALHKPSQSWYSPVKVLTVDAVKASSRAAGRRLHRYRLLTTP